MKIEITHAVCVRLRQGADTLYLHTTLPLAVWPFDGLAFLKLDVARGQAEQYVTKNFPKLPFKLIEG